MKYFYILLLAAFLFSCKKEVAEPIAKSENSKPNIEQKKEEAAVEKKDSTKAEELPIVTSEEVKKKLEKMLSSKPKLNVRTVKETKAEVQKKKEQKKTTPKKKESPKPQITWVDESYDFGFIEHGDTVRHTYSFINTGKVPVQITNVVLGCGCTLPKYPLEEILPGRRGEVAITFLSENKVGVQNPSIEVFTTASKEAKPLTLKGVVR